MSGPTHCPLIHFQGSKAAHCRRPASGTVEATDKKLYWGLKYIVRGDVVLPDGIDPTLDALSETLDLPILPYLEDQPKPLE